MYMDAKAVFWAWCVCEFIPTSTDTGVLKPARVFTMCVYVSVCVYDVCVY